MSSSNAQQQTLWNARDTQSGVPHWHIDSINKSVTHSAGLCKCHIHAARVLFALLACTYTDEHGHSRVIVDVRIRSKIHV